MDLLQKTNQRKRLIINFINKYFYLLVLAISVMSFLYAKMDYLLDYIDNDSCMHLIRFEKFIKNPTLKEQLITESNYPFGEINHWTRVFDIVALIIISPFMLFLGYVDGISFGSIFFSLIFGILSALVLAHGIRKVFNSCLAILAVCIFSLNPGYSDIYVPSLFDHQPFEALCGMIAMMQTLFWLKDKKNVYLKYIGISLGLATHTVEGPLFLCLFMSFFVLYYIKTKGTVDSLYDLLKYYFFTILVIFLLNPPYQGYGFVDNGRLSIVHIMISFFLLSGLYLLKKIKLQSLKSKLCAISGVGILSIVLTILFLGKEVYQFPVSQELYEIYEKKIAENASILKKENYFSYIFALLPLLIAVYMYRIKEYKQIILLTLWIGGPLFVLSLLYWRFMFTLPMWDTLPIICFIKYQFDKSLFAKNKSIEFPDKVFFYSIGYISLLFIISIGEIGVDRNSDTKIIYQQYQNNYSVLCPYLKDTKGALVADVFTGPKYIRQCKINVVSTPYHRNIEGIVDGHHILMSEDNNELIKLLEKHKVSFVLMEKDYLYYNYDKENENKLYYRLINEKDVPNFLERIIIPRLPYAYLYKVNWDKIDI